MNLNEAAQFLGIRPRTLRARLSRGEIPGTKTGGIWVSNEKALEIYKLTGKNILKDKLTDIEKQSVELILQ